MKSHEKFLARFLEFFKQVDLDNNGIMDEAEFGEMIMLIDNNYNLNVDRLLTIVDPYNNEQITFSQCVTLLSSVGQRHQHSCDYLGDDPNWRGPGFSLAVAFIMRLNDTALQLLISADYTILRAFNSFPLITDLDFSF